MPDRHFLKDPQAASEEHATDCLLLLLVPLTVTVTVDKAAIHSVLASPESPMNPDKQEPQENEVDLQGFRFKVLQEGAPVQVTAFKIDPTFEITCFLLLTEKWSCCKLEESSFEKL